VGVEFTLQIPFTPIELSLGLEFPKEEPGKSISTPTPTPTPDIGINANDIIPLLQDNKCYHVVILWHSTAISRFIWEPDPNVFIRASRSDEIHGGGVWNNYTSLYYAKSQEALSPRKSPAYIEFHNPPNVPLNQRYSQPQEFGKFKANFKAWALLNQSLQIVIPGGYEYFQQVLMPFSLIGTGSYIKTYINTWQPSGQIWDVSCYEIPCNQFNQSPDLPKRIAPQAPQAPQALFPNPPPRKRNMDECCRDSVKLLRAIYKGLGIAKFPGKLPTTIIQEVAKKGEKPAEPAQVPIADFVDLLDWQFRRDDERWGQWEIQIDVKDADLTKEGDQGKSIKFPNLAESIAELEGQMLSVMANVDALVAITTKNLVESGMARQEAIKGYLAAKAIIKYMAFKSTEIDVPVPMTFTPGAETISALIIESEGHIKGTDYVEKETLRDILLDLLQAAAVIRAVHWQKIDSKTDTKSQLLNLLKGTVDLAGLISKPQKASDGEEKKFDPAQNFEDFIDSVEDGFRNTTGITDIQNPYGKTPDRRPRIRQIGDNISQAGGDN
jgi:hypothetical protein